MEKAKIQFTIVLMVIIIFLATINIYLLYRPLFSNSHVSTESPDKETGDLMLKDYDITMSDDFGIPKTWGETESKKKEAGFKIPDNVTAGKRNYKIIRIYCDIEGKKHVDFQKSTSAFGSESSRRGKGTEKSRCDQGVATALPFHGMTSTLSGLLITTKHSTCSSSGESSSLRPGFQLRKVP